MSISRTNPPVWRQARTLKLLFWTGFGFAPLAALLLLVGDTGFPIKVALILGLGSVVLIGLSVVLRSDSSTVERDLYAALADSEAELKRAIAELRGDMRRQLTGREPAKAVASAPKPRELPYEARPAEEPRRPRPVQQDPQDYLARQANHGRSEERDPAYLPETTAVPRQRWEDEYPAASGYEADTGGRNGRRGQAVEAWRAEEPAETRSRRSRGVENGWADEVYNSGSQPRASRANGAEAAGGRHYREPDELDGAKPRRRYREDDEPSGEISTRRYREDDELSGEISARGANGSSRRREYASGETRSRNGNSSYMDTYYGDSRR